MSRGNLVLWADSAFDAQIITSFLEAAEYQVDNLSAPGYVVRQGTDFDAAIVVLDHWDSQLDGITSELRTLAGDPKLPIIVITTNPLAAPPGCNVLQRPILLFKLAETIHEVIPSRSEQLLTVSQQ